MDELAPKPGIVILKVRPKTFYLRPPSILKQVVKKLFFVFSNDNY